MGGSQSSTTEQPKKAPEPPAAMNMSGVNEKTFIMVKPDGVQRGIAGEIMARFEKKGFTSCGAKMVHVQKSFAEQHYIDLAKKPFYGGLTDFLSSGPVFAMCWKGKGVVSTGRKMLGTTNPKDSAPGTIRGDYSIDIGRNICHGSDSVESAEAELNLWFPEGIIDGFAPSRLQHVYEN